MAMLHTLNALKDFLRWLATQPGYRSRIVLTDIDYLSLSEKETRAAKAPKYRAWPTLEQIRKTVFSMPVENDIERRNQALIALPLFPALKRFSFL
ncbi:MAG: site-specific tyrosine recombinase XerC [Alphaproteobacteria bacterium]|nr:site-specific tyrosine recombinase XerC [Alphaproteobacteria bacterium]